MPSEKMLVSRYSTGSRILHWLIALIVICLLAMGFFLDDLPKAIKPISYTLHKSFGITVLFLMLVRIVWIFSTHKPKLPSTVPTWQRILARSIQHSFYLLLLVMPLAGWIMSVASDKIPMYFGIVPLTLPGVPVDKQLAYTMFDVHSTVAWIILGLLVLHVAGALKHHFIDKDGVLKTML